MEASTNNYSYLIAKIDEFIRKYYLNRVVRGCLYLAASFFASYVLVAIAEYFGNFSSIVRSILFYGFLLLNGLILIKWIVIPLLSFYRLGRTISHEKASEIIGHHFSHVKDKLLNTLQLKKLAEENEHQKELIEASINQKIIELQPVPFTTAIKIKDNKRYLRYVLPPLAVILFISATAPSILSDSTERLLKYNQRFVKKAPFQFVILNNRMSTLQGEDFELKVKMTGNEIPQDIYLEDGVNTFKLEKDNIVNFRYTFRNLQDSKEIRLIAGEFSSEPYTIEVKKKPSLLSFDVKLEYPSYLRKRNETLSNTGDLTVPAGTKISWNFNTSNTSALEFSLGEQKYQIKPSENNTFNFSHRAIKGGTFSIKPVNAEAVNQETSSYKLTIIPDLHPLIQVSERADSVNKKLFYFVGQVSDDHGFSNLRFHYRVLDKSSVIRNTFKPVGFDKSAPQSNFFYVWNLKEHNLKPGQQIEYYFEVWDNDAVNGAKSARSSVKTLTLPSEHETERKIEASSKAIEKKIEQAVQQAGQVEREAKKLNQELLSKRNLSFDEKKQVEQLLQKQKDLEKLINEIKQENKQNQLDREEIREPNEELLEKQKQIEDLFNNVLDEKTRELLKNIEKLLDQNNKNQTQQELSKMQVDNKMLQKELDRILDLYKQLEFDQKLNDVVSKLEKLAEKQEQLKEQTQKNSNASDLKQQQENISKEFDRLQQDMKELEEKDKELGEDNNFKNPEKEQQQIEKDLDESSKSLQNKNFKKAGENQQNASQQMKQLSQKLSEMQEENEEAQNMVNMQNLREILDNLLKSSFEQEKVMQDLRNSSTNDPNYTRLTQKQKDIKDNLKLVQDSLYSLSRQVPQIESTVNKEIEAINKNIDAAISQLVERRTLEANRNQQYAMTAINNLALMLSEVQSQLQKMMQNAKQGGKGKQKSLSQLSKIQEELNRNMQKAREQMQGRDAEQGNSKRSTSEQFAKMAREQQLIRQALQEINRDLNKDGEGGLGNLDKLAKEMEQSEVDLVHKKIQQETLIRQQEILTKLLDAEKAERERELDKQRESKEGQNMAPGYKIVLEEFQKLKQSEVELLKTLPPSLNSFYKLKVGSYFRLLNTK